MTEMALFQGLLDREGRVLDKANRLVRAGFVSLDADAPARAARAYMQAVNLDPDDIDGYARVLAFVPEDAALWVRKGDAHRRRNELEEAQTAFDRALRIDSELKEALEGKSSAYLAAGDPQRA